MNTQVIKFTEPWGFSKLDVFRQCKAKFKYQFIDKLKQQSSPALERGGDIHKGIESYLNGWTNEIPPAVSHWQGAFDELKQRDFYGEQNIGIDKDWNILPDWFMKATWLRVKMDAYVKLSPLEMIVIDFKTGKYRVPSTDQVELYAIAGLSIVPTLERVKAEFWFLDSNDIYQREYSKEELLNLRSKYEQEAKHMYERTDWGPEPSQDCRFCPYSKTKRGPCKY